MKRERKKVGENQINRKQDDIPTTDTWVMVQAKRSNVILQGSLKPIGFQDI